MRKEDFFEILGELDDNIIKEQGLRGVRMPLKKKMLLNKTGMVWMGMAACLVFLIVIAGFAVLLRGRTAVSVHACGTHEEITAAGVVMSGGSISDKGEMKGHPLMFYLLGRNISSVRFSCKNQQINFMDWTEKREEYGNARNFTVSYGDDESEYYYLTIDWIPDVTIRRLTDHENSSIADLPEDLRSDIIVMEIVFADGRTATKGISVSLLDDGTFFAVFDDYEIGEEDAFVRRPDSQGIPRNVLYAQGSGSVDGISEDAPPMIRVNDRLYRRSMSQKTSYEGSGEEFVYLGKIKRDVTDGEAMGNVEKDTAQGQDEGKVQEGAAIGVNSGVPQENFQANHPIVGAKIYQWGDDIIIEDNGEYWLYEPLEEGEALEEGNVSTKEKDPFYGAPAEEETGAAGLCEIDVQGAEEAARAYYSNTVFEVISMKEKSRAEAGIVFEVCVSKGGIVQEPNRTIELGFAEGMWEVVNEGY